MTSNALFGQKKLFIGMVHLRPTVGYPKHPGMEEFIRHAVADARALEEGGATALCIENDMDQPHTILITAEQEQCMVEVAQAVTAAVSIPVGIGVLLNDWKAALRIAKASSSAYVRIDVFVDRVSCDAGIIEPPKEAVREYQKEIDAENILLFTDIQVKHKVLLEEGKSLVTSAQQAIDAGAAAVTVTGTATGQETPIEDVRIVKEAFPDFPVFIGAGINAENVAEQFSIADGGFVGTSLKTPEDTVDPSKVQTITTIISSL